ncbi:MAG: helix-turn-helix transcriptional regulator, partial [Paraburkholderia sp.]
RPATRLIVERATRLVENFRYIPIEDSHRKLAGLVGLIAAAFGDEAGLSGSKRAVGRALMFEYTRRYVRAKLQEYELSPESVVESLGLPRSTIYRLFKHEGGLGAYIRHLRLRAAADELVRFPGIPIQDIGFSVGFKSASDFTRAFRRAYEMTPQEMRLNEFRYRRAE